MEPHQQLRVACDAFVLLEKKSLFYSAKWELQRLELSHELLEFSPRPQVVLRFRDTLFVVLRGVASADEASSGSDKHKLLLDVRSMEDVRKSWVYQTAAKTTRLDVYIDTEETRDGILFFTNKQLPQQSAAQLPEHVPYAVPVATVSPAPSSVDDNRDTSAIDLTLLIEESFQALADAQTSMNSHPGSVDNALTKYRVADQGFERAARLVPDERTRQLFEERRQEIQSVIRRLEETLKTQTQTQTQRRQPSASEALLMGITGMGFPEAPLHNEQTADSEVGGNSNSSAPTATATATTSELDERLERLKNFAAQQEVERAQREHKPAPDDLRLRLQALRNEKSTTPSAASLHERFQRLRGGGSHLDDTGEGKDESLFNRRSSVDRIIQQVQEEIALGIVDADEELDEERVSQSSDNEEDNYGESSGEDSATDVRQTRKSKGKSAPKARC